MAPIFTPVSAIVAGKINLKLKVRVINLWSVPDYTKSSEENFMHMVLLDEKLGKIQATARKTLLPKVRSEVQEGCAYEITNVLVCHNDPKFQTTRHRFKLNLIEKIEFIKIDESVIPMNHFDFVSFKDILESEREDKYLDVIGHVVEKNELKDKEYNGGKSKLIDVTLEDSEGNRIHCSLWGKYAEHMHYVLTSSETSSPVVVVIQLCKLKKFYGAIGISNAFYGTKLIFNADLPAIKEYRNKIGDADIEVTQGVSQISGNQLVPLADDMLKTRYMTIENLIESSDQCCVIVLATICDIEKEYGWYYDACNRCAARIKIVAGRISCPRCKQGRNAVPRFKVHVQVMDTTGSTSFILFDRNVTNFVGRSVQDLIDAQGQNNISSEYPSDIDILVGKQLLFKVEITDGNLVHNWRNYAVKRASDDVDLIKKFIALHNIKTCAEDEVTGEDNANSLSLVDDLPLEKRLIECGDSTNSEVKEKDVGETPVSKTSGKRSSDSLETVELEIAEFGEGSITKPPKAVRVKIEKEN